MTVETKQLTFGAGTLYFDPKDSDGDLTGERELGQVSGMTLSISQERVQAYDSTLANQEKIFDKVIRSDRTINVTVRNMARENVVMFFGGTDSDVSQAATAVTDEAHTVSKGRHYQLGVNKTSNPTGVRGVTSVTVTSANGVTTHAVDTDYTVDAALGRIFIVPSGSIADETPIQVDYTPTAQSRMRMATKDSQVVSGALRWISKNSPAAANMDLFAPNCQVFPNGDLELLRQDALMELGLTVEVLRPGGTDTREALYIDGRPA